MSSDFDDILGIFFAMAIVDINDVALGMAYHRAIFIVEYVGVNRLASMLLAKWAWPYQQNDDIIMPFA